ncbi:MAG: 3-oxoacyl-[ACP] reductase, partial [uncultured Craurococcus sp.]
VRFQGQAGGGLRRQPGHRPVHRARLRAGRRRRLRLRPGRRAAGGGAGGDRGARRPGPCGALRPRRRAGGEGLCGGGGRGARRDRRAGEQCQRLRLAGHRGALGAGPLGRRHGDGAGDACRPALPRAGAGQHPQRLLHLGLPALGADAGLCGGEGAANQLHRLPGGDVCAEGDPGECGGAGLHRIPRRLLGAAADLRPQALQRHPRQHSLRPDGHAGGGGECRALPGEPAGRLGDRPDDHRRRRADAL